jgi:hypothetical protein
MSSTRFALSLPPLIDHVRDRFALSVPTVRHRFALGAPLPLDLIGDRFALSLPMVRDLAPKLPGEHK